MKFYVVLDATGHPVVMGEERLTVAMNNGGDLDVAATHGSYEAAMDAVTHMRAARQANAPALAG